MEGDVRNILQRRQKRNGNGPAVVPFAGFPNYPDRELVSCRRSNRRDLRQVKVRHCAWQIREVASENVRQLHDLDFLVKRHCRIVAAHCKESIDAAGVTQELEQRRLRKENDLSRDAVEQGKVADELNRISKAVVTSHQDAFAGQGCAVPNPTKVQREM